MTSEIRTGYVMTSGDVPSVVYIGNKYATATITSANGTTPITLFTAPVGYVITELGMQIDPISTIATSGMVNLFFTDSNFGTFFNIRWFIPQNITNPTQPANTRITNGPGFYWNNKVAGTSVAVNTDTALTAGSVRFFARYALTTNIGT